MPKYALYLDGALVHEGPARSLAGEVFVDRITLPVAPARPLIIAALVMPATGVTASGIHDRIGLIAEVRADGKLIAVSDASWTTRAFTEVSFQHRICALGTSQQEHWSAGLGVLNVVEDGSQAPARVLGSVGTPPWKATLKRDCEVLCRDILEIDAVFFGQDGSEQLPLTSDIARVFNDRPIKSVVRRDVKREFVLDGSCNVVTFDAGRTRMVRPLIAIIAADGNTRLEVYYDIGLTDRPRASLGCGSPVEGFADSISGVGFPLRWQPIMPRGARFVTVRLAGAGHCKLQMRIEGSDYPYPASTAPRFDQPVLQEIWKRSVATLRSSTTDAIVDTVWRENMLWTFDAAVTGQAHFHAFSDHTQWRRALALIARWAKQNGPWPTSSLPSGASGVILPDQMLQATIALADYSRLTGDRAFAREAIDQFEAFINACMDSITPDGYFIQPDWCWHWIDWAPIDRRPYSLPINLLLMLACETMLALGDRGAGNRGRLHETARTLRSNAAAFWDESHGCYRDRVEPPTPRPLPNQIIPMPTADYSAHANALALRARLGTPSQQSRVAQYMIDHLDALPFAPGWTDLVLSPLLAHGHVQQVIGHLERLYLPWIESNQPTWSEGFEHRTLNTAHGWGATAISVLKNIAALRASQHARQDSTEPVEM